MFSALVKGVVGLSLIVTVAVGTPLITKSKGLDYKNIEDEDIDRVAMDECRSRGFREGSGEILDCKREITKEGEKANGRGE